MDMFWTEFADFCNRRGVFGIAAQWRGSHVRAGKSHLWHNVDFEDQDLAFDQELEKVEVVVRELKRPIMKRVF